MEDNVDKLTFIARRCWLSRFFAVSKQQTLLLLSLVERG